jgi:hypothetical protein
MSKLLRRLSDPAKSGVYRASHGRDIQDALRGSGLRIVRVEIAGAGKEALLERIARALDFPAWFGGTWDALEDCLSDLSWSRADGHVLLIEGVPAADERGILIDILRSVAAYWAERKRPFFAVFVGGVPASERLPELYREGQ